MGLFSIDENEEYIEMSCVIDKINRIVKENLYSDTEKISYIEKLLNNLEYYKIVE